MTTQRAGAALERSIRGRRDVRTYHSAANRRRAQDAWLGGPDSTAPVQRPPSTSGAAGIWYNSRASSKVDSVAADNLVEIDNVEFHYDVRPVLKGINMRFPRGKVVSIMGLSGCGKTTTLRLIGGQLKPSRGQVRVAGDLVHELDQDRLYALRRRMGMLFQFGALFTDLSVFDNVAFQMREHTALPEPMIRDLVLMKLNAVGLRGTQR